MDRTTRFFWAASYGQIYPELQRLEAAWLIAGEDAATGRRRRRVFRLTEPGQRALRGWLRGGEALVELRDESLLRLFFADALPSAERRRLLEDRLAGHRMYLGQLRALAARPGGRDERSRASPSWSVASGGVWVMASPSRRSRP